MLKESSLERYNRQIILPGVGEKGQELFQKASVLVVGAGGLGCPILQYLVGGGIGKIGIADADEVSLSNLQRQILYTEGEVGINKAMLAAEKLSKLNSEVLFKVYTHFITADNIDSIAAEYDIIVGATDNFESRYLIDNYCQKNNKPYIHGSVSDFEGQFSVFNYQNEVSYKDVFPSAPESTQKVLGVIGAIPGIIGSYMALEVIKIICGLSQVSNDGLYIFNGLTNKLLKLKF